MLVAVRGVGAGAGVSVGLGVGVNVCVGGGVLLGVGVISVVGVKVGCCVRTISAVDASLALATSWSKGEASVQPELRTAIDISAKK